MQGIRTCHTCAALGRLKAAIMEMSASSLDAFLMRHTHVYHRWALEVAPTIAANVMMVEKLQGELAKTIAARDRLLREKADWSEVVVQPHKAKLKLQAKHIEGQNEKLKHYRRRVNDLERQLAEWQGSHVALKASTTLVDQRHERLVAEIEALATENARLNKLRLPQEAKGLFTEEELRRRADWLATQAIIETRDIDHALHGAAAKKPHDPKPAPAETSPEDRAVRPF